MATKPGLDEWPDDFQGFHGHDSEEKLKSPVSRYLANKRKERKAKIWPDDENN